MCESGYYADQNTQCIQDKWVFIDTGVTKPNKDLTAEAYYFTVLGPLTAKCLYTVVIEGT